MINIESTTISLPSKTNEFLARLEDTQKIYSCNAEDAMRKKMLALQENLLAVEADRGIGRCGISLDELDHRLGTVLGEVVL